MREERTKVTTDKDEWEAFQGSLLIIATMVLILVGGFAAIFKLFGLPEVGAAIGAVASGITCFKVDWMRETIHAALFVASVFAAVILGFVLLGWAFS